MIDTRRLLAAAIAVAWCATHVSQSSGSPPPTTTGQPGLCELRIEGHSIVSLTLLKATARPSDGTEQLAGERHMRPGHSLWLPAGRYRVTGVEVEGGYQFDERSGPQDAWFELAPGTSHALAIGAPLAPRVTVKRHGRFLEMDADLVDAAGRSYLYVRQEGQRPPPPQFTVYKNEEVLGSDSFEYG